MLSERARRSIGSVLLIICVSAAVPRALSQTTRPQETFRSGVSILELAASVLDSDGTPVRDLRESDFDVTIGGSERKVVVARFRESSAPAGAPSGAPATQPSFGSNASGRPGQVIVLAVDAESLKSGHERLMLDAAARLLQSLGPEDAVGLLAISGKSVDLTRDHSVADGWSRSPADFDGLTADVELRRIGSEQPIGNAQAAISQSDDPTRRVAEAEFATDGLEPSLYSVIVRMQEGRDRPGYNHSRDSHPIGERTG